MVGCAVFACSTVSAAIGLRSLADHARPITRRCQRNDLPGARRAGLDWSSRQTDELTSRGRARAAHESVLGKMADDAVVRPPPRAVRFRFARGAGCGAISPGQYPGLRCGVIALPRFAQYCWAAAAARMMCLNYPCRPDWWPLTMRMWPHSPGAGLLARAGAAAGTVPTPGRFMAAGAGARMSVGRRLPVYPRRYHQRPSLGRWAPAVAVDIAGQLRLGAPGCTALAGGHCA